MSINNQMGDEKRENINERIKQKIQPSVLQKLLFMNEVRQPTGLLHFFSE
jgi:hypothetical protein